MKKLLSILIASVFILQTGYAFAENADISQPQQTASEEAPIKKDSVQITLSLKDGYCHSSDGQAVLDISDGEKTYTKIVNISNNLPVQEVTFYVDEYISGKTFSITPVSGIDKLFFQDTVYTQQNPLLLTPIHTLSETGVVQQPINVQYIPSMHSAVNVVLNGRAINFPVTARNIGEHVVVPLEQMAKELELSYSLNNGIHTIASANSVLTIDQNNDAYISKNFAAKVKQQLYIAPQFISGTFFVPVSLFSSAFNLTLTMQQSDDKPTLYIATGPLEQPAPAKTDYVNSKGLSSQTDYLVWISKHEYKVRVYMGSKGNWHEIKSFTCAIGAPGTPTCEGTYKYYQAQSRWSYPNYYVGPIMRFNGGYAIHSTLLNYNGTPKDNRVGVKISHGCIRLRPDDIGWMFYYVPLYTTIHITA